MAGPRTKPVALKDIAERANISIAAVSMALSGHPRISDSTRDRVISISKKMGYKKPRPTSKYRHSPHAPRATRSLPKRFGFYYLGMRLDDESIVSNLHDLVEEAARLDVRMEVQATIDTHDAQIITEKVLSFSRECDGLLISGLIPSELTQELINRNIPCVVVGRTMASLNSCVRHGRFTPQEGGVNLQGFASTKGADVQQRGYAARPKLPLVSPNEFEIAQAAIQYLTAKGFIRIGFMCEHIIKGLLGDRLRSAYRSALADLDVPWNAAYEYIAGEPFAGGLSAAKHFTQLKTPPDAYFVMDARVSASFIQAMKDLGSPIPEDAIVIYGQHDGVGRKYNVTHYPMVSDSHIRHRLTVELLYDLCTGRDMSATEILLPIVTHNMSDPDSII